MPCTTWSSFISAPINTSLYLFLLFNKAIPMSEHRCKRNLNTFHVNAITRMVFFKFEFWHTMQVISLEKSIQQTITFFYATFLPISASSSLTFENNANDMKFSWGARTLEVHLEIFVLFAMLNRTRGAAHKFTARRIFNNQCQLCLLTRFECILLCTLVRSISLYESAFQIIQLNVKWTKWKAGLSILWIICALSVAKWRC